MACQIRKKHGRCSHHQCQYSGITEHGYECVDIVRSFCEVGLDCIPECQHSFKEEMNDEAIAAFEEYYGE